MMKLILDHSQRLNLHALLGAQRADVGSIRAIWAIQDRIALTHEEADALELKREIVGGRECVVWNPGRRIAGMEFEFSDHEVIRIRSAIDTWTAFAAAADRAWLEPIVDAIFSIQ